MLCLQIRPRKCLEFHDQEGKLIGRVMGRKDLNLNLLIQGFEGITIKRGDDPKYKSNDMEHK